MEEFFFFSEKNDTNELTYKLEKRLTVLENKLTVARGKNRGMGQSRSLG